MLPAGQGPPSCQTALRILMWEGLPGVRGADARGWRCQGGVVFVGAGTVPMGVAAPCRRGHVDGPPDPPAWVPGGSWAALGGANSRAAR